MAKIKLHNPELAANSVFSNFIVESVISDPTVVGLKNAGRIWFNTNEKKLKGTFINQAGDALEIKSLADNADVAGINGSITAEVERATAAEAALTNALNIETAARIAGDSALDTRVTAVESQVNGKIGDLTNLTTDTKDTIVAAVNEIDANIDAEVARATAAESALNNTLTTAINAEVTRATAAEAALNNTLTTAITAEVTRATTAEAALTNALNTAIAARIAGDAALTSDLNSNFLSKTSVDAQTVISDTTFNGDLTTDGNLSVEGDTILNGDTIIGDSVSPTTLSINSQVITATDVTVGKDLKIIGNLLVQGAQTIVETEILKIADNIITLNNGIGDVEPTENAGLEVDRGTEGVQTIIQWNEVLDRVEVAENNAGVISLVKVATASDITAETTRAKAAEAALTNALSTETVARTTADSALDTRVTAVESQVNGKIGDLTSLTTDAKDTIVAAVNEIDANIDAEVVRATAAEATLTNALNTETASRIAGDDALTTAINDEVTRATTAEATLTNALNTETASRISADSALDTRVTAVESQVNGKIGDLTNLTTDAKDTIVEAVNEIDANIDAEVTRATAAEATLTNALSTETTARIAGDDVLTTAINAEVTRATAAEAALTNTLNAEVVNRTNAESALGLRIDNVNTAAGIAGDVYAANETANFISTATSLVSADNLLDAALKTTIDDLASTAVNKGSSLVGYNGYVEADVNIVNPTVEIAAGTIETAIAEMAASINIKMQELENRYVKGEVANVDKADTYTIAHNLDTEFVDVSVQVYDESDLVWRFDLVVVEVIDANTVKVSLASGTAAQIRYVIHCY